MARLLLSQFRNPEAWLDITLEPVGLGPGDPDYGWTDGIQASVSFCPDTDGVIFSSEFDTRAWQLGKVYFVTLANSFARIATLAQALFPISCHRSEAGRPEPCTMHVDVDSLHILLRGVRRRDDVRVALDCFVHDPPFGRFAHLKGQCTVAAAEQFGRDLLKELEAVREYDDSDSAE